MTVGPFPPAPLYPAAARGCICPPTAEATCQRFDCGRKDHRPVIKAPPAVSDMLEGIGLVLKDERLTLDGGLCEGCDNPSDLCSCRKP